LPAALGGAMARVDLSIGSDRADINYYSGFAEEGKCRAREGTQIEKRGKRGKQWSRLWRGWKEK
jgi:hypothetical protein